MIPTTILTWNVAALSAAMRITEADVIESFKNGRMASWIIGKRLGETDGWENKTITDGGIYFCPSYMKGSGRKFDRAGFLARLEQLDGFVLADIEKFPNVPCWKIPVATVNGWFVNGDLGLTTDVSRARILRLLDELGEQKRQLTLV